MRRVFRAVRILCRAFCFALLVTHLYPTSGFASSDLSGNKGGKSSRISQELTALHREYSAFLAAGKGGRFQSGSPLVQVIDDRVVVDATASGDANVLKVDLEALGMQQAVAFGRIVSGQLPIAAIPRLEGLSSLNSARAAVALTQGGPQPPSPGAPGR